MPGSDVRAVTSGLGRHRPGIALSSVGRDVLPVLLALLALLLLAVLLALLLRCLGRVVTLDLGGGGLPGLGGCRRGRGLRDDLLREGGTAEGGEHLAHVGQLGVDAVTAGRRGRELALGLGADALRLLMGGLDQLPGLDPGGVDGGLGRAPRRRVRPPRTRTAA